MSRRIKARFPLVIGTSAAGLLIVAGTVFSWSYFTQSSYFAAEPASTAPSLASDGASTTAVVLAPAITHLPTPEPLRAVYMTQCVAASPALRDRLIKIADETEINAIVVDLKDYSGAVAFPSTAAIPGGQGCRVADFEALVKKFHEHNIYVIGRLTVFQDPLYTKVYPSEAVQSASRGGPWLDRKGLSFVDVSSKPFHQYIITLAKEAYALGVDEINFDYVRYPSDGPIADARYINSGNSYADNLEAFFADLVTGVRGTSTVPILSADLFGMVTTNYNDLNIGQVLERALPYFDYIDPMVYPSHYPDGFNGWKNPNQHPYDIVYYSLEHALARTVATTTREAALAYTRLGTSTPALYQKPAYAKSKIRPWLQDFNYPVTYTPEMVKAQIQATYDLGLTDWLMWDPANRYTVSVLEPSTLASQNSATSSKGNAQP